MSFDRLIRFLDKEGVERRGNVESDLPASELPGKEVQLLSGSFYSGYKVTDERAEVVKVSKEFGAHGWCPLAIMLSLALQLLCPLPSVAIIICAGVNYESHASETKVSSSFGWRRCICLNTRIIVQAAQETCYLCNPS